jgi:hypothetical protein
METGLCGVRLISTGEQLQNKNEKDVTSLHLCQPNLNLTFDNKEKSFFIIIKLFINPMEVSRS